MSVSSLPRSAQLEEPQRSRTRALVPPFSLNLVCNVALGLAGAAVVAAALSSLAWPRYHDAPVMEYAAWLIRRGYRPYRDFFDMNLPGTYFFHVVGQRIFGSGDVSFRVRDVLVLGA